MLLATIVLTPSIFLDDIKTFLSFSGRTINVFPSTFISANALTIVFVLISFTSNLSTTVNSFSKTLELNIDLIQTEGAATVEAQSNGARGLLETAQVSIANTIELARNVEIPVMTASGLTPTTVALAFAAGASAVGVGSCINKLRSEIEMIATASSIVECAKRFAPEKETVNA